jgi:zinc protease
MSPDEIKSSTLSFSVHKTILENGLTVLVRPVHHIPRVDVQLWYNVGSKDEGSAERGMAHLIEHMSFKGTKQLSESDINLITHKLTGYANAFTSPDYTAYVFRFPSRYWHEALPIFADCMINCRFDEQMLASEARAVIQELKMYNDDYHSLLFERLLGIIFPEHPYHHPVIGYKTNLAMLTRDDLYAFYKEHYHPANATLTVVGDVDVDDVVSRAQEHFGSLSSPKDYHKRLNFINSDLVNKSVTLYREVKNPWCYYAYVTPGLLAQKWHLFNMISLILGKGKSSRLYKELVNKEQLATHVESFMYDFFQAGLLCIAVQPRDEACIPVLEEHLNSIVGNLADHPIEDWEFQRVIKRAQMDCLYLLEHNEKQAHFISTSYLATGNEQYLNEYLSAIKSIAPKDIQIAVGEHIKKTVQHRAYLKPVHEHDKKYLLSIQEDSDLFDQQLSTHFARTLPVEEGKAVNEIERKPSEPFQFPKPSSFTLSNGMEVLYHHTSHVPSICLIFNLRVDFLYDPPQLSGISNFLSRLFLEGTKHHPGDELSKYLETNGIYLVAGPGIIIVQIAREDFEKALTLLSEILTESTFDDFAIEKVRKQLLSQLKEYWDTPVHFVDQLARELIYKQHPYSKSIIGYPQTVSQITPEQLREYYKQTVCPDGALMVIVGDLTGYTSEKLKEVVDKVFGLWTGKKIPPLLAPKLVYEKPEVVKYPINRDQIVLGLVAPSVSQTDKDYDSLSLLDVVLTGGAGSSMSSRLFQLRERTGLFYTIGGSLVYGARNEPGMLFIKTIVSPNQIAVAENAIKDVFMELAYKGVTQEEFEMARDTLLQQDISNFEDTQRTAQTLLFLKRCALGFDLFDKRSASLTILKKEKVNEIAKKFCAKDILSVIQIGRVGK